FTEQPLPKFAGVVTCIGLPELDGAPLTPAYVDWYVKDKSKSPYFDIAGYIPEEYKSRLYVRTTVNEWVAHQYHEGTIVGDADEPKWDNYKRHPDQSEESFGKDIPMNCATFVRNFYKHFFDVSLAESPPEDAEVLPGHLAWAVSLDRYPMEPGYEEGWKSYGNVSNALRGLRELLKKGDLSFDFIRSDRVQSTFGS
ncbi:MAG: hypothetical protein AAF585_26695, partial [Verrucomicrobiota bacterium]